MADVSQGVLDFVRQAVEQDNPNTDEVWDEEAISDLAAYAEANGMVEVGGAIDLLFQTESPECLAYFLYDLVKWVKALNG